jgi:hypothetical protein
MSDPVKLSTTFKQSLTTTKMQPFVMKVSLFDAMFYYDIGAENNIILKPRILSSGVSKGKILEHNIIAFKTKDLYDTLNGYFYTLNGLIDGSDVRWDDFCKFGIDI